MGKGLLNLLNGPLGLGLLVGAVAGLLLKIVFDLRFGYSLSRSLIETFVVGALAYGVVYGVMWYFTESFLNSGKPLFELSTIIPTPTVTR
jgi:hypothetical protein